MNYFHLEAKVVSRGAGRSVIAAAAYASCSRLYNDMMDLPMTSPENKVVCIAKSFFPNMHRKNGKTDRCSGKRSSL